MSWRASIIALACVAVAVVAPIATLEHIVVRSRACFAAIEAPRGPALPDCRIGTTALSLLGRLPFMHAHARRIADEQAARWAALHYLDAAVGTPRAADLAARLPALAEVSRAIDNGSGRLRFDELGPPLYNPYPADLAFSAGDDAALAAMPLTLHYHQRRAIRGAVLRGDGAAALALAQRHLESPDSDLQLLAVAACCAAPGPADAQRLKGALTQAVEVERHRAEHRSANFSRHFGEVRVLIEACAARLRIRAPEPPSYGYAGSWDERERLMALRLRAAWAQHPECLDPAGCRAPSVADNVRHVRELLGSRARLRYRLELAALLGPALAGDAERLLEVLPGEPAHLDRLPRFADEWLAVTDAPFVTPERWAETAAALEALDRPSLRDATVAMWGHAAMGHWLDGRHDRAADALAALSRLAPERAGWLRAAHALIAGTPPPALTAGDAVSALFMADAAMPDADRAAALADEAQRLADARGDDAAGERARWMRVALGRPHDPPRDAARAPVLGPADIPQAAEGRRASLDEVLHRWHARLARTDPAERRAARYRIMRERDDSPQALVAELHLLGRMLDAGEGEMEVWLAAATAIQRSAISLRRLAYARMRAAVWRDDADAAALWRGRLVALLAMSRDRERAELHAFVGL